MVPKWRQCNCVAEGGYHLTSTHPPWVCQSSPMRVGGFLREKPKTPHYVKDLRAVVCVGTSRGAADGARWDGNHPPPERLCMTSAVLLSSFQRFDASGNFALTRCAGTGGIPRLSSAREKVLRCGITMQRTAAKLFLSWIAA